jgi:ADP-heptose:LPS heptosyltransferase
MDSDPAALPTLGIVPPASPAPPQFRASESEVGDVLRLLLEAGVPEGARIIILNANASDLLPLRRWAAGNYVELASRLIEALPGVRVAFTGSAAEAAVVEELVASVGSDRAVSVAGRTSLRQLLVLFGLAEVLVTNDSGPAHFAALTSVDVVALFGPETPLLFSAPGPRSHPIWAGIACSPCVNAFNNRQTACRDNVCMKSISVGEVFEKVSAIYASRVSRPPGARLPGS